MKKLLTILTLLFGLTMATNAVTITELSSQNIKKTFRVSPFTQINASCLKVVFTPGSYDGTICVKGPKNVVDLVTVTIGNGSLSVGLDRDVKNHVGDLKTTVYVTAPLPSDIHCSAGAAFSITADATGTELDCKVSSGASFSASALTLSKDVDLSISSGASLSIGTLNAHETEIDVSSGASATIASLSAAELDAEASSGASISIKAGHATKAEFSASSAASISAGGVAVDRGSAKASSGATVRASIANVTAKSESSGGSVHIR